MERFEGETVLRLYSSKIKYQGCIKTFKTKEEAIDYLYAQTHTNDERIECPHCGFKRMMKQYTSKKNKHETVCNKCGKRFIRIDKPKTESDFYKIGT